MVAGLLLSVLFAQAEVKPIPIEGYLPAHLPGFLKTVKPKTLETMRAAYRAYRPILMEWEVPGRQDDVASRLSEAYGKKGFGHGDTGGTWQKDIDLGDRTLLVTTQPGRLVRTKAWTPKQPEFMYVDKDKFTEVTIIEYPAVIGPMPKDWPKAARAPIAIPKGVPKIELPEFAGEPQIIGYYSFEKQVWYSLTWYINESETTAFPRMIAALEKSGKWKVSRHENGTSLKSADDSAELAFQNYGFDVLPKGWCYVRMNWKYK